jgi:hypothetical protein
MARLGDPREIVDGFTEVYRPSRRNRVALAALLATGLLLGAYGASGTLASAHATRHTTVVHAQKVVGQSRHPTTGR